jgi:hypothetical protein
MKLETTNEIDNTQELLPEIVERIFLICREDSNFKLKDEMEIIENKTQSIKGKIKRQEELLIQSNELKKDLLQRLSVLDNQNERKQMELLESIGEEL